MKTTIISLLVFLLSVTGYTQQQAWQAVGPDDYEQVSKPKAIRASCFIDSTGTTYISYLDSTTYSTTPFFQRIEIVKETTNGWIHANTFEITNYPSSYVGDLVNEIVYVYDSLINGSAVLITKYFDGTNWSVLGSPYPLNTTTLPYLVLRQNKLHELFLLYYEATSSTYPTVLKWNGTSWGQVGNYLAYTSYSSMLLDFDSNNDPYVYYYDALSNQYLIKKFDGTLWNTILSQVPGGAVEFRIFRDSFYLSFGASGYWGGTLFYSPSCSLYKYNGSIWDQIGGVAPYSGAPLLPMNASTTIVFDSSGTIYLTGGTIWQIKNGVTSQLGAVGNLYIKGVDSFYIAGVSDYHNGKVRFVKRLNNIWYEDFPVSISPFTGGYLSTYSQPFIPNYNPVNFHQFCGGSNNDLYISSTTDNVISAFTNGIWDTSYYSYGQQIYYSGQFIMRTDTGSTIYRMAKPVSSTSPSNNISLLELIGNTWNIVGGNPSNSSAAYGDFCFDKSNTPYVAYVDITSFGANRVRVKKYNGTGWLDISSSTMPFFTQGADKEPLLACDTANNIYVLYVESGGLYLQKFDGTNWNALGSFITNVDSLDYTIGLTTSGMPIVAAASSSNGHKMIVEQFDGVNWNTLGLPGFSYGAISHPSLVVVNDTPIVAYEDKDLNKIFVAKYNGTHWGALGSTAISRDASSFPNLVKSGNDIYVSYFSDGLFVKKSIYDTIVPLYPCGVPAVTISGITDTTAYVNWTLANEIVGYEYNLSTTNNSPSGSGIFTSNLAGYLASNLQPNTTYYFFIRTICGIDTSSWVMTSFTTTNTTNASNLFLEKTGLKIYPNPVSQTLNIQQSYEIKEQHLGLYDVFGRLVRSIHFSGKSVEVMMTDIASGVYFIKDEKSRNNYSFKVIKQ